MLCKHPFYQTRNFILYFVSLLLTSPSFCYLLDYSAHFHLLRFTSAFGLSYLRMFLTILVYVTFYLRTISDSRMFVVTILTWSIQNTVSVLWNLLVCCVATIHKNKMPAWVKTRTEVVAKFADWLLLTPEDCGSYPVLGNFYKTFFL